MVQGIPFGDYILQRRLGSGGMAEVFLAKRVGPEGFEKTLVIKRILPHLTSTPKFRKMFLNEARAAAGIEHRNLVHVSDFGEVNGTYYLAMEYVDGITLAALADALGPLSAGIVARISLEVLQALEAIHRAKNSVGAEIGLVHRDVSPRNVMLTRDGSVKLLDLGIATGAGLDPITGIMGTTRYMSPEAANALPLDGRADIFSCGVVAYLLLSGNAPFKLGEIVRDLDCPSGTPEELWQIIHPMMGIERDTRPSSALQIANRLELFVGACGLQGTRTFLAETIAAVFPEDTSRLSASSATKKGWFGRRGSGGSNSLWTRPIVAPTSLWIRAITAFLVAGGLTTTAVLWARHSSNSRWGAAPVHRSASQTPEQADPGPARSTASQAPEQLGFTLPLVLQPMEIDVAGDADPAKGDLEAAMGESRRAERKSARTRGRQRMKKSASVPTVEKERFGLLTIDTQPWTEVYLGKRRLGITPLHGSKLPVGKHKLHLTNPKLGLDRRVSVEIRAQETTRLKLDF